MAKRNVLVTGGMGGLGESICTKMADAGYQRGRHLLARKRQGRRSGSAGMTARGYEFRAYPMQRSGLRLLRRLREARSNERWARWTCSSTTPASLAT